MSGIKLKTPDEIAIMAEAGKHLGRVKNALKEAVKPGVNAMQIEELARKLIKEEGAEGSFDKVPGYHWVTCINVNSEIVHGIPTKDKVFKAGDVVSVDVGLYFKGFHSDTSITVGLGVSSEVKKFLNIGTQALEKAISRVKVGNYLYEVSEAMESTVEAHGYSVIKALVGHGIGRELHEDPQVPCFVPGRIEDGPKIELGMVLAVEVMYAMGGDKVEVLPDGWTIAMRDGKISALFEETVAVTQNGPKVLTL
jgi:methionyl aminopeptidase